MVIGIGSYLLLGPRSVSVPPPTPSGSALSACEALAPLLPKTVEKQDSRTVTPDSPLTAAWGEPPIVLRCGVPRPAALGPTSEVYAMSGVDWFEQRLSNGDRFTTTGRTAYVEVTVPNGQVPGVEVLADLGAAISKAVPVAPAGS